MTIGLLEKKLEGGGENHPPPALIPLAKQPARRRVKRFTDIWSLKSPSAYKTSSTTVFRHQMIQVDIIMYIN